MFTAIKNWFAPRGQVDLLGADIQLTPLQQVHASQERVRDCSLQLHSAYRSLQAAKLTYFKEKYGIDKGTLIVAYGRLHKVSSVNASYEDVNTQPTVYAYGWLKHQRVFAASPGEVHGDDWQLFDPKIHSHLTEGVGHD